MNFFMTLLSTQGGRLPIGNLPPFFIFSTRLAKFAKLLASRYCSIPSAKGAFHGVCSQAWKPFHRLLQEPRHRQSQIGRHIPKQG